MIGEKGLGREAVAAVAAAEGKHRGGEAQGGVGREVVAYGLAEVVGSAGEEGGV